MKISRLLGLGVWALAGAIAHGQTSVWSSGEGVNGTVAALAVQPDGKVLLGGLFSAVQGAPRQNIARLHPDGSLDDAFSMQGINGQVLALAVRPGGGFVAGGEFNQALGTECLNLAVFGPDGQLDPAFHGQDRTVVGTNGVIRAVAVQPDGAILIGGSFSTVAGQPRMSLARFRPDGSLDSTPKQTEVSGTVQALAVAPGLALAGGNFRSQGTGNAASLLKIPLKADDKGGESR